MAASLVVVGREAKGDGAPEEPGAHLHGQVAVVVRVPDPDVAAVLHYAGIGGRLHTEGLECAEGRLDIFAGLDLHGDGHGALRVHHGYHEAMPDLHRLRGGVEDAGKQIGYAALHRRLHMLGLAGDKIFFVQNRLALRVVELEGGVDLPAALDGLLVELRGAAARAVEDRLKAVADVEDHVDGADSVGRRRDALMIAV